MGAVGPNIQSLLHRSDFLKASRARHKATPAFVLQARHRGDETGSRVGFTCSKKVGNAVARNRAKRRLRAVVREVFPDNAQPGWDYVLIGRRGVTADYGYDDLKTDLKRALNAVHR